MDIIKKEFILDILGQIAHDYKLNFESMKARYFVSKGKNCLKNGMKYELKNFNSLGKLAYLGYPIIASATAGASNTVDINCTAGPYTFGIEVKNKGAFEGGSKKLVPTPHGMGFIDDSIHKYALGNKQLYNGLIFSKENIEPFRKDVFVDISSNIISEYYSKKGSQYIQIEQMGLYHTGRDVLNLGVPYFLCENARMRIRSTKHLYSDITAALQYNRKSILKSPYSIDGDGVLPPSLKVIEPSLVNEQVTFEVPGWEESGN